jgi:hypothetical protein
MVLNPHKDKTVERAFVITDAIIAEYARMMKMKTILRVAVYWSLS